MKKIFVIVLLGCLMYGQSVDCVGNSITASGYPQITNSLMIQDNYDWRVYNYGVPGITVSIAGFDYINTPTYQEVMNRKSEHIVVLLGTGDVDVIANHGTFDWEIDFRILIDSLQSVSQKVFLGTIPYKIYSGNNSVIDNMNTVIIKIAQEKQIPIIDFNTVLGTNPDNFLADGVHPSTDGKQKLANLAFNELTSYPLGIDDEYWEAVEEYEKDRKIGWFGCSKK